jgi:nicotinamidase-related amidase
MYNAGMRPDRNDTGVVIVDAQERLAAAMPKEILERAVRHWVTIIEMANVLKLPIAISEQYPKGLGYTLPVLKEAAAKIMPPVRYLEKIDFSCVESPLFDQFLGGGRRTWIVAGMETHICVYQTVRGLLQRGYKVHVPVDACVSRRKLDWETGRSLMDRIGAFSTTTETVLFDLVSRAQGEEFRALAKLVK